MISMYLIFSHFFHCIFVFLRRQSRSHFVSLYPCFYFEKKQPSVRSRLVRLDARRNSLVFPREGNLCGGGGGGGGGEETEDGSALQESFMQHVTYQRQQLLVWAS